MDLIQTYFSGGTIDRRSAVRKDPQLLQKLLEQPRTCLLPISEGQMLVRDGKPALLGLSEIATATHHRVPTLQQLVYLGRISDQDLFAFNTRSSTDFSAPQNCMFLSGRELMGSVDSESASLLAYARGIINWHDNHQFCGHCGAPNISTEGGFVMKCSSCGQRSFPRLDPAIIVLVAHDDRCLLGRQASWPEQRFSTIAGFAEPGENLEDAVRREVLEETNVSVGRCNYLASQPWPFPSALMIGFHAQGLSTHIKLNDAELIEAGWFSREDLRSSKIVLPPQQSIAFELIAAWHDLRSDIRLGEIAASVEFNAPGA